MNIYQNPLRVASLVARNLKVALTITLVLMPVVCRGEEGSSVKASMGVVSIEHGGRVRVDGQPFFPIALYSSGARPPTGFTYAEIAAAGFNVVTIPPERRALEEISKYGLRGIVYLGGSLDITDSRNTEIISSQVKAIGDHPALLCWESINEPSWTYQDYTKNRVAPQGLAAGHRLLKSLDPRHVILATHSPHQLVKTIAEYSEGVDAISTAFYPIIARDLPATYGRDGYGFHGDLPNQSPSGVGEYTDKTRKVAGEERSVWTTIQAFSWTYGSELREKLPPRFPTYDETRFMAFDAVIHGANGLLFWGTHHIDSTYAFWKDLTKVTRELHELAPILLSPIVRPSIELEYLEMGYSDENAIEMIEYSHLDKHYLIAANRTLYPAKVRMRGIPSGQGITELQFESQNRSVALADNVIIETFPPLAVRIYRW